MGTPYYGCRRNPSITGVAVPAHEPRDGKRGGGGCADAGQLGKKGEDDGMTTNAELHERLMCEHVCSHPYALFRMVL